MFARNNERKASILEHDPMFRNKLERGKNMHPELFTKGFFIVDFSLRGSPKHGATTEAENNNADTGAIKLIN